MVDSSNTIKMDYYDLKPYHDEIATFIKGKKTELDVTSNMKTNYDYFNKSVFAGKEVSDEERYPHTAENYKVYKSSILESSLSGYSALLVMKGLDGKSQVKIPAVKAALEKQFKQMNLIEKLSNETVDDWILKGEAISIIKYNETIEEYRNKEYLVDQETGDKVARFNVKQFVHYKDLDVERINPFDFFVDAYDYASDPRGCCKIVRKFISAKELLTSDAYPLLSQEEKKAIIAGHNKNGSFSFFNWGGESTQTINESASKEKQIEVLTFYGDYTTNDCKVLSNVVACTVNGIMASCKYSDVSTNRIIYAAYHVDENTHRGISPMCSTIPVNRIANRAIDLFLQNLDDISNPIMLYAKGSIDKQQVNNYRKTRQCEFNPLDSSEPKFWSPQPASPTGLQLIDYIAQMNKNVLGLNNYISGDSSGAVRSASEATYLHNAINARMRVETDVFNYNFMLRLFNAFYTLNRELALSFNEPLDDIFADESLQVMISTNASRADAEGEFSRLMQMLSLPLTQMIFSNLTPEQVIIALKYLMSKAELNDFDNLLQLMDDDKPEEEQTKIDLTNYGVLPPEMRKNSNVAKQFNQ